jgi:hypothetical protein
MSRRRPDGVHSPATMLWFAIVFLVLLKIPVAYLAYVVWWAVKDPPQPGEGCEGAGRELGGGPAPDSSWWRRPPLPGRTRRRGPHGSPTRRPEPVVARSKSTVDG